MLIAEILRNKGSGVVAVSPGESVAGLLTRLAAHNIGAVVVMHDDRVVGVASERDIVRALDRRGTGLLGEPVSEIMTTGVVTCTTDDTEDTLTVLMTENRIRHVPVLNGGELVGIVSIGDVVKSRISQLEQDRRQLEAYITQG
ncbi:CBS domain-containing protein [Streptomonospora wellingtoniae]|uniref:CBS domain-containing protein n=1 Tax=Streptomonospora wellingtoniae TaxID=3075544 RepID=A0ABU2KWK0_9ACTN|nr:CBS domain-containing protein [Streptomonospora sp. DSM 45055]MDT0303630.1 CBS domain-containing protein [Streptomonospora sp. DSM 45055]